MTKIPKFFFLKKKYKFIKKAVDYIEVLETFFGENVGDQSKLSEVSEEKKTPILEKKKSSLILKKCDSTFFVHGNAFILTSNGESPLLPGSTTTVSPVKELGPRKAETMQNFSYSRTTSINSFKYYDDNKSDFTFQMESGESSLSDVKKIIPLENKEITQKRKSKSIWCKCNFFGCGVV